MLTVLLAVGVSVCVFLVAWWLGGEVVTFAAGVSACAKSHGPHANKCAGASSRISTGGRNGHYALRSVVRICSHSGGRFPNPFGLHHQKVEKITSIGLVFRDPAATSRS
jgi:hypothetical protein